jgi:hypothetical protein
MELTKIIEKENLAEEKRIKLELYKSNKYEELGVKRYEK